MSEMIMDECLTVAAQPFMRTRSLRYFAAAGLVGGAISSAKLMLARDEPSSLQAILLRFMATICLMFGFFIWVGYMASFDVQLSPANVQLVPGLQRYVRATALTVWAWMSAFVGLELVAFGVPFAIGIALTAAAFATSVSRSGSARALSALLFCAIMVLCSYPFRWSPPVWVGVAALVVSSIGGASWLWRELGANPEGRAVPYERWLRNQRRVRDTSEENGWAAFLRRTHLDDWFFARLLRQRSSAERTLQGLGTTFHWGRAAFGGPAMVTVVSFVFYAIMEIVFRLANEKPSGDSTTWNYPFNLAFFATAQLADSYRRALWSRRKEESLLVLVPGGPRGPELNAWLMRSMLKRYAVAVVVTYALVIAAGLLLGASSTTLLKSGAAPFAASLFVAPVLLRDYSRMHRPVPLGLIAFPAVGLFVAQFCITLRSVALDPMLVLAAGAALAPLLLAIRYTQLVDAPPAFPAGRLAS